MRAITLILITQAIFCFLTAFAIRAADYSIHIEWGYTPPSEPPVSGFQLYQEGVPVCSTSNPDATSMDCDVSIIGSSTDYTLTALFTDGSESPHSATYTFSVNGEPQPEPPAYPTIYKIEVN